MSNRSHEIHPDVVATAIAGLSLSNAMVLSMTMKLIEKGILSKHDAQSMILEIVEIVRHATDNTKSIYIADTLCNDLEDFAAQVSKTNG